MDYFFHQKVKEDIFSLHSNLFLLTNVFVLYAFVIILSTCKQNIECEQNKKITYFVVKNVCLTHTKN